MLCTASPISSILHKMEEDEIVCKEVRIALGVAAPTPHEGRESRKPS